MVHLLSELVNCVLYGVSYLVISVYINLQFNIYSVWNIVPESKQMQSRETWLGYEPQ